MDLQKKVMTECDNFSEDVKFWAEYKTGIKEFRPWLENAEKRSGEGLPKPQTLDEANAIFKSVILHIFLDIPSRAIRPMR